MHDEVIRLDDAGARLDVVRFDAGALGKAERTPVGGVRIPARVTRAGVLTYMRSDGTTQREYRPPEEVFADRSLSTLRDAAVTVAHPSNGKVTPDTFRRDAVGYVGESGRRDDSYVSALLTVQEADAIRRIDAGELAELSCGYACRLDLTPGTTPGGERYDAVQRDITYNHVALLPRGGGRAGRDVALRLDGAAVEIDPPARTPVTEPLRSAPEMRNDTMKTERIDGIDYEIGTPAWAQARQRADAKAAADLATLTQRVKDAETARETATARADSAEKKLKELEAELTPERLDARTAARASLIERARKVLGAEEKLDGKTDAQIMAAVVAKTDTELKLDSKTGLIDGKSTDYVTARFDIETKNAKAPGASPLAAARADALIDPVRRDLAIPTLDQLRPNLADKCLG